MKQHKTRISLRGKFTLLISGIFLVTFGTIAFFLVRDAEQTSIRDLNQASKAFASLATTPVGETYVIYMNSGSFRIDQQVQNYISLDSDISNMGVIDLSGKTVYKYNTQPTFNITNKNSFATTYTYGKNGLITQIVVPYFDVGGQHSYSVAYSISSYGLVHDVDISVAYILIFSILGLVVSAAAMYELTTRLFISPIERISKQALLVSQGNYDQVVGVKRQDEIGDLATSVNNMSSSLKSDITELKQLDQLKNEFITITSHNLRTPLTIIKGNLELLSNEDLPPNTSNMIRAISDSATSLSDFSEDMLTISSLESDRTVMDMKQINIADLTSSLHQAFAVRAAQRGIALNWNAPDPAAVVTVSASHIQSAIRNLLDNALKFTDRGGHIDVILALKGGAFTISVSDNGAGITPEEQARIFDKYHRGKSAKELDYAGGTGIGLYVTKLIVVAHHGTIAVHSEGGKGATFIATIPQEDTVKEPPPPKFQGTDLSFN